jgi:catechol-2,3-dioxygenase
MKLGAFSISLSVKDIHASKKFYESLGFSVFAGDIEKNYLIMKNESSLVGLFQGMIVNNILTFNPGWDQDENVLDQYDDVRDIQKHLTKEGIKIESAADEQTTGPASIVVIDPDGNAVLIHQHI